jgi:hypothetical protein
MRMVVNTMTFFTRDIGLKTLGLEIKKDISIPRIGCANEEQSFIRERIFGLSIFISMGKVTNKICKHQGHFRFGFSELEIEFINDNDPF